MQRSFATTAALLLTLCIGLSQAAEPECLLLVRDAPAGGLVLGEVAALPGFPVVGPVAASVDGRPVPAQLIPPIRNGQPVLVALKLPGAGAHRVTLRLLGKASPTRPSKIEVSAAGALITHDLGRLGGLPSRIAFAGSGKVFDTFDWNDRLHDPTLGSYRLDKGKQASIEVVSTGPLCTVVRVNGRYARPDGKEPASQPEATYDWFYFHEVPLVYVRTDVRQSQPTPWKELHFLELRYPDESFRSWAGGSPPQTGTFTATKKSHSFGDWAMLREGANAIAMLRAGRMLLYDGRGGHGAYLHAHGNQAWAGWNKLARESRGHVILDKASPEFARRRSSCVSMDERRT